MKVKELQEALQDIAQILEVAGTKSSQKDFEGVLKLLEGADEQELDPFLRDLEQKLVSALKQSKTSKSPKIDLELATKYANLLQSVDMDEAKFVPLFTQLQNDTKIRKGELTEIAKLYQARPANTVGKLEQSIKTRFYERIYDRDATEMALKATPW